MSDPNLRKIFIYLVLDDKTEEFYTYGDEDDMPEFVKRYFKDIPFVEDKGRKVAGLKLILGKNERSWNS